jgi:hypothetical protein
MEDKDWEGWWESRGRATLELLLWAVWDPIGGVPLDEYSLYCDPVVQLLRQAGEADAPLAEQAWENERVQLQRNVLWRSSVERLAGLLAELRWS